MANLPIPDEQTWTTYTAYTGSGPLSFTFSIFAKADLRVKVGTVELAQADFTFAGTLIDTGYDGGSISLVTPAAAQDVLIWRQVPAVRATDFAPASTIPVASIDAALDKLTAHAQDARRDLNRTFKVAVGEAGTEQTYAEFISDAAAAISADAVADVTAEGVTQVAAVNAAADTVLHAGTGTLPVAEAAALAAIAAAEDAILHAGTGTLPVAEAAAIVAVQDEGVTQVANVSAEGLARIADIAAAGSSAFYATTAAGLAGTTTGQYFLVVGNGSTIYAYLYLNSAGTAVLQASYPDYNAVISAANSNLRLTALEAANGVADYIGCEATPVTDSAVTNNVFIFWKPVRRTGRIGRIKAFGLNSGGTVTVRRFTLSGGTFTQVGSDYSVTIAAGSNDLTAGTGFGQIPVTAGEYIGFSAWATNGKVALRALKMGFSPYWLQASGFTGGATGTFSTTGAPQIQFEIDTAGGVDRATLDVVRSATGEVVYKGRDTTVVQAASTISNSGIIYVDPTPFKRGGIIEQLDLGLSAAGPIQVFLLEPQGGGSSLRWKRRIELQSTGAGANSFTTANGLPADLHVEDGWLIGFHCYTTGSGAGMTYTSGGASVDGPGFVMTLDPAQLVNTDMVPTFSTADHRYEYRAKIRLAASLRKLAHINGGVYVDEDFSEGTRPASLKPVGTWTFSAGKAVSGGTGLSNLLEGRSGPASQHIAARAIFQVTGATDAVYFGLKDFAGNYSSLSIVDFAANAWKVMNAWVGGSSEPAGTYQTNSAPFIAALVNARDYMIEAIRYQRKFTFRLTDLVTWEQSEITKDFTTWGTSADLASVGLMNGRIAIGAKAGVVWVEDLWHDAVMDEPTVAFLSDSMGHSRSNWSACLMGLVEAAAPGGALCTHVDGTQGNSFPLLLRQCLPFAPTVKHVVACFGMNDNSASQATFEARMAEGVRYALDQGCTVTLIVPPLKYDDTEPYTGITSFLMGLQSTYGIKVLDLKTAFSTNGAGATRNDTLFSAEDGFDVHFNSAGALAAFKLLRTRAPYLRLSRA